MLLGRSRLSLGCRAEQKCHDSLDRKRIRADLWRPEPFVLAAATWEELILWLVRGGQLGLRAPSESLTVQVKWKTGISGAHSQQEKIFIRLFAAKWQEAAPAPTGVRITNMPAEVWRFSSSAAGGKSGADKMRCTVLWCWKNIWPKHSYLMSTSP